MNSGLYNSSFEIQSRVLMIASFMHDEALSEDQLIIFDFIAVYAHEFFPECENIHGENGFMYSEFSARKQLFDIAIRELVKKGFLSVVVKNGFLFRVSPEGNDVISRMECQYSREYRSLLKIVFDRYMNYTEKQLRQMIYAKAVKD